MSSWEFGWGMKFETLVGKDQNSNETDNYLKAHDLEEKALMKVLKNIFFSGKLSVVATSWNYGQDEKIEEDEEDEMGNEMEFYGVKGGVCMHEIGMGNYTL